MKNQVLVIGRPNVGKSTFINKVLGKPRAVTFDEPGITRDLNYYETDWAGTHFDLVDSGGIYLQESAEKVFQPHIESKVKKAAEEADRIILLTDGQAGVHPIDIQIATWIRPMKDKVVVAVNKLDDTNQFYMAEQFHRLGLGQPFPLSSIHGNGIGDLLDAAIAGFSEEEESENDDVKVAFVGRPNVGKSSLLNALINDDLVLVTDIAGTTRDSVAVTYHYKDMCIRFVDTAGIRKQAKISDGVEYYSVIRTQQAIDEADVVVVLLEIQDFLSEQDKKIIRRVLDAHKGMILYVNKWDLGLRTDALRQEMHKNAIRIFPLLEDYPFVFGSALKRVNLGKLLETIPKVAENQKKRVGTPALNRFIEDVIKKNPPSAKQGGQIKILYATQTSVEPPTFVFFVNQPTLINPTYKRFVLNRLRKTFTHLHGVTPRLEFRARRKEVQK